MFNSIRASIPQEKRVRGYTIKRLPLGGYLSAMESVKDAPSRLLKELFPDQSAGEVLEKLRTIRPDEVRQLLAKLMTVAPEILLTLLAELTGIPYESLRDDPNIGLDGLAEILEAFFEVNKIENFLTALKPLTEKLQTAYLRQKHGSSA